MNDTIDLKAELIDRTGTLADGLFVGSSIPGMDINKELGEVHELEEGSQTNQRLFFSEATILRCGGML